MRLVTYDRGGTRRLGAWAGDVLVDLPDAVGHPAFPTTMEALVARNAGTTLDAAREALRRPQIVEEAAVREPRLLVPIIPSSLRTFVGRGEAESPEGRRLVVGPGEVVEWPASARYLGCELEIACILGRPGRKLSRARAATSIFGYTLMGDWSAWGARRASGKARTPLDFATSLGPCVVTADELDPSSIRLVARIGDEVWSEGTLETAGPSFPEIIAEVSRTEEVCAGEVYGSAGFGFGYRLDPGKALRPGTVVELEAEGIGVLSNRVGERRKASEPARSRARTRPGLVAVPTRPQPGLVVR
jgi:hypothetical protein